MKSNRDWNHETRRAAGNLRLLAASGAPGNGGIMDPDAFNMMNVSLYGAVLMLIKHLMLMIGLASALYILVCLFCLACDNFVRNVRFARRRMELMTVRPGPFADDLFGVQDSYSPNPVSTAKPESESLWIPTLE
jgi:hypothetical protein